MPARDTAEGHIDLSEVSLVQQGTGHKQCSPQSGSQQLFTCTGTPPRQSGGCAASQKGSLVLITRKQETGSSLTDVRASKRTTFVDALVLGQNHKRLRFAARLGQSAKPTKLEGHPTAHSWSCQYSGLVWVGDVTSAPCKSVLQYPLDVQQQGHEQSQPHSVLIDRCANSTSLLIDILEGIPLPSICLELQSAATQQYENKAMPGKYLLGVLVTVVDEVAGDFVFGPHGTIGRPQGLMTLSIIDKLHSAKLLSSVCEERWLAFLQIWQNAGWSPTSLVDFVSTLRPLQYRNDLDESFICSVTRDYLHGYIADLYTKRGFAMVMRSDVEDFLDIVHHRYSQCDAVLLPAKDAVSRLQVLFHTQT